MLIVWLLTSLIVTVFLADWLLCRVTVNKIADIFEDVPPFNVVAEVQHPETRTLTIKTSDGVTMAGSLHWPDRENPHGLVLFFPELNGNHWMARRYCDALLADGFALLAFDFRNQGRSESSSGYQPIHWVTEFELRDVEGVLQAIESDAELSTMPLLAFGVSRGGVAALIAGCRYPRIQSVIADSAFGTMHMTRHFVDRFVQRVIPVWLYRLLPEWYVRRSLKQGLDLSATRRQCEYIHLEQEVSGLRHMPVLLISGKRDSYVTPEVARKLQLLIGDGADLWVVDHAKHNMARSAATAEYDRRIVRHFRRAVGLTPDTVADTASSIDSSAHPVQATSHA